MPEPVKHIGPRDPEHADGCPGSRKVPRKDCVPGCPVRVFRQRLYGAHGLPPQRVRVPGAFRISVHNGEKDISAESAIDSPLVWHLMGARHRLTCSPPA